MGSTEQARKETAQAIREACINYGFFYLDISSHVDAIETEELVRLAREFFVLPQEEKDRLSLRNEDHARGYSRLGQSITAGKVDKHEELDFFRPVENPDKTKVCWGNNQWPTVEGFWDKYKIWIEKMKVLGRVVMEAMAEGLGLTAEERETLRSLVNGSFWAMGVIGYPPLPDDHDGISFGSHKFLHTDSTPGALQVYLHKLPNNDNNSEYAGKGQWINVDPIPGCVVCNIASMFEIWTNGLYKSTLHRVIHKGTNYRISIPFFFEPNFNALVEPLPSVIALTESINEEQLGRTYEPVVYGEFLVKKVKNNFLPDIGKYA
ncbi:hypothetical protein Clacol_004381 [Clathrus columnatus]|uniref:Fe2OG dioxygenase domain-containing protein n=1 Tax=Clathrus columnatus TaxID=1419009 RepID=A0AAV5A798_9AGAM|nr:hypothetical protein Clacol_004381 [Clathrus columnatus]